MIGARRRTHVATFSVLAVLLPLCFLVGIGWRPVYAPLAGDAVELLSQAGVTTTQQSFELVSAGDYQFQLSERLVESGQIEISLAPTEVILQPDVLVYWDSSATPPNDITDRSLLLGRISGTSLRQFSLPPGAQPPGHLAIYSRGQSTLLTSIPITADLSSSRLQGDR